MKKWLVILLAFELLIAIHFGHGGFLHRRNYDRAFFTWYQNPTPESKLELDRQKHINELYRWGFSAVAFGGMAVVTLLVVYVYKRRQRG